MSDIKRVVLYNPSNDADAAITTAGDLYVVTGIRTDALFDDGTVLTPKFAAINVAASGDNTIVSAVSGKKIRVLSYSLVCGAAVNARWEDGAGGTALSGIMEFAANSGISVPYSPVGHFETTANTILNLELSGAVSVDGHLVYVEI